MFPAEARRCLFFVRVIWMIEEIEIACNDDKIDVS